MTTLPRKRVRAGTAMEIARIDRVKFNEFVADGFYGCAPATRPGASRIFEFADLVTLFIFARLTEFGVKPATAGSLACRLKTDRYLTEDYVTYAVGQSGADLFASHQFKPRIREENKLYPGIGPLVFHIEFHLAGVRDLIAKAMAEEEERAIIGQDDAE